MSEGSLTLDEALTVLIEEHLEDFIYDIRSRCVENPTESDKAWWALFPKGNSWEHPRVKRWSEACMTIKEHVDRCKECGCYKNTRACVRSCACHGNI